MYENKVGFLDGALATVKRIRCRIQSGRYKRADG